MKKIKDFTETQLISEIAQLFPRRAGLRTGIGDDTAVMSVPAGKMLLSTVDSVVEGVDFTFAAASGEQVGWKVLCQNLSDIAAMGGKPLYALISLGLPPRLEKKFFTDFYHGIKKAADRFNVQIAGGDISRAREFFASLTVLGEADKKKVITRGGARAGDAVLVTGTLGGSITGKHLSFTPRLREAAFLTRHFQVHAMIDISDGLVKDLGHILRASRKGAAIDTGAIPIARDAVKLARRGGKSALERALSDGEDFELLFTCAPREAARLLKLKNGLAGTRVTRIGEITVGKKIRFFNNLREKKEIKILCQGYEHF